MSDNTDKRTATQRIEDLEKVVTMIYQAVGQMKGGVESLLSSQGDMVLVKDALKLLNKRTEAIIQVASPESGINVNSVSDIVVKMNVEDLKAQVAGFVASGHLIAAEISDGNSYLVCEESNPDGTLANPRIQFRLDSQDEVTGNALKGKKVGDVVVFGDNKYSAKILEIYSIVEPVTTEAAAPAAAPAASDAPAAESQASAPESASSEAPAASLDPLPAETPVPVFVPSDGTMMTASGV